MPTPREQAGGLAEASRLLQEGLNLLAQREREVDALLEDARERALLIREEAELRAAQITAEAERQRSLLETQLAELREEVAALAQQLDRVRAMPTPAIAHASPSDSERTANAGPASGSVSGGAAPSATDASGVASGGSGSGGLAAGGGASTSVGAVRYADTGDQPQMESSEVDHASEDTPRWGRRSDALPTQQAVRSGRPSRPKWLPPWLPFLLILLVAAGVVATNVNGQPVTGRASDPSLQVALAGVDATSVLSDAPVSTSTTLPVPTSTPVSTSVVVAQNAGFGRSATSAATATVTAMPTPIASAQPVALPPSGSRLGTPIAVPGDANPQGPIVAAYTSYVSYTVHEGDTLNRVASQFGVSGDTIVRSSGLVDPNLLVPGQVLTIPRDSGWLYRAQAGETLDSIATRLGVSSDELAQANPTLASGAVRVGDLIFVPDHGAAPKR